MLQKEIIMGFIKVDKVSHLETPKYEYWGMLYKGMPNGYGIKFNHIQRSIILGAFDNGILEANFSEDLEYIMGFVRSFQPSTFYKDSVFIVEILPNGNRTSRYGIAITSDGMYIGEFPNGYGMKHIIGIRHDMDGNADIGKWNISISLDDKDSQESDKVFPF